MSPILKARALGALVVLLAFAGGVIVGRYLPRTQPNGVIITVKGTDRIPRELDELALTDSQRVLVRGILRRGMERVDRVVQGFAVPMDAAVDSTDREIRAILTAEQVRALDISRETRPLRQVRRLRKTLGDSGR